MVSSAPVSFLAFLRFLCLWTTWMKSCLGIDSALLSIYSGNSLGLTTFEKHCQRHCLGNEHSMKFPCRVLSWCLLSSSPKVALPRSPHRGHVRWWAVASPWIPGSGREQADGIWEPGVCHPGTHPPHPSAVWEELRVLAATSHLCLLWGSPFLQPPAWQAPTPEPQEYFSL